jgi:hypothetical protein
MPVHGAVWIDGKMIQEIEVDATDLEGQVPGVPRAFLLPF